MKWFLKILLLKWSVGYLSLVNFRLRMRRNQLFSHCVEARRRLDSLNARLGESESTMVVQINGRVTTWWEAETYLPNIQIDKVVVIRGKLINFTTKPE